MATIAFNNTPSRESWSDYWPKSRRIHNNLLDCHKKPAPESLPNHLQNIAEIIAQWNAERYCQIHLAHSHFTLEEDEAMVGQTITLQLETGFPQSVIQAKPTSVHNIDLQNVHPYILAVDSQEPYSLFPYAYWTGSRRDLSALNPGFFEASRDYISRHKLQSLIAIEIAPESDEKMTEFVFDRCTLSLNSAGVPFANKPDHHIVTGWAVEVRDGIVSYSGYETYYGEPGKPHEVYKSESASTVDDLLDILRYQKVWDDELWKKARNVLM